jgi:hypothetical protein
LLSPARVLAGGGHVIRESEHLFVAAASHQQIVDPVLVRANGCGGQISSCLNESSWTELDLCALVAQLKFQWGHAVTFDFSEYPLQKGVIPVGP